MKAAYLSQILRDRSQHDVEKTGLEEQKKSRLAANRGTRGAEQRERTGSRPASGALEKLSQRARQEESSPDRREPRALRSRGVVVRGGRGD